MNDSLHISCPACLATNRIPSSCLDRAPHCGKCKHLLFAANPVDVDNHAFQRIVANTDIPVLIDFWAPWCGPCKMMAPVFESVARALEPRCRLVKVDTETHQELASQYQVRSIPTLLLLQGGVELARRAGAMDARSLQQWVESHL
ncbi:thioredoxin TrxC [Marinobacterium weihaiense]|uniref:Thioredoxin n=1 Tax=Marinobacterium weihaiense TaxID=2851016 RepID=A0ABS6M6Q2_9GAMM|nr:thioredoxin TrxC [Marinobacterium weihaiense]MBV0931963.1 thioredoxin TrxC [Marinobacterium weihaiense]